MSDKVTQLRLDGANVDFIPQAVMRASMKDVEKLDVISFTHFDDDLDGFDAVMLELREEVRPSWLMPASASNHSRSSFDGTQPALQTEVMPSSPLMFMMQRYDAEPADRITLFLPSSVRSADKVGRALRRILRALNLSPDALVWERSRNPEL